MFSHPLLVLSLGAILVLGDPTASAGIGLFTDSCLSREEIRVAVASGRAVPFGKFMGDLRSIGDVVSSELCHQQGRLVYVVKIVTEGGQIEQFVLEAADVSEPEARPSERSMSQGLLLLDRLFRSQ